MILFAHTLPLMFLHQLSPLPPLFHAITHTPYSVHLHRLFHSLLRSDLHVQLAFIMDDDQVITPTAADQNDEVVTTTDTTISTTTAAQPRRSQRLIESQKDQAATPHVGARLPRAPRAPRSIDPVQRRKKGQSTHHFPHHASSPLHPVSSPLKVIIERC